MKQILDLIWSQGRQQGLVVTLTKFEIWNTKLTLTLETQVGNEIQLLSYLS
jgi:hypothetical protein